MAGVPNLTEYAKKKGVNAGSTVQPKDGAPNLYIYAEKQAVNAQTASRTLPASAIQTPTVRTGSGRNIDSPSRAPLKLDGSPITTSSKPEGISGQDWAYRLQQQKKQQADDGPRYLETPGAGRSAAEIQKDIAASKASLNNARGAARRTEAQKQVTVLEQELAAANAGTRQQLDSVTQQLKETRAALGKVAGRSGYEEHREFDRLTQQARELESQRRSLTSELTKNGGKLTTQEKLANFGTGVADFVDSVISGGDSAWGGVFSALTMADEATGNATNKVKNAVTGNKTESEPFVSPFREYAQYHYEKAADTLQRTTDGRSDLGKRVMQTGQAVGNMLASSSLSGLTAGTGMEMGATFATSEAGLGASAAQKALTNVANVAAKFGNEILTHQTNAIISAGSAGHKYIDATNRGADQSKAMANAILSGLLEYESNKMFSGTPLEDTGEKGYVTKLIEHAADKLGKSEALGTFLNSAFGKGAGIVFDKAGEGLEEVITAIGDPILERITWNPEADLATVDEVVDAFIGGLLLSFMMSGGEALINNAAKARDSVRGAFSAAAIAGDNAPRKLDGTPIAPRAEVQRSTDTTDATEANLGAKNAPDGATNENGLAKLTQHEVENLSSGSRNKIVSTFRDALSFVRNALSDNKNVDRAYMGKVPDAVAQQIKASTGVDVTDYAVMLNGNDVRHIIKNHGDATKEAARGQLAITADDIAMVSTIIAAPDSVTLSQETDGKGRRALVFEKQIGDTLVAIEGVSDGRHALETDTMRKRKSSQVTGHNAGNTTGPVSNAQSAPPQSSFISDTTIAQASNVVKSDRAPRMLNGQPTKTTVSNLDTSGTQGTQTDRTPRMLNGQPTGAAVEAAPTVTRESIPAKAQQYLSRAENAMLRNVKNALGVDRFADRADIKDAVQRMSAEYLKTGKVSPETRAQLFNEAYERGRVLDSEMYDQYKDLKGYIRTTPISISEDGMQDIADFQDFRRAAFGTMRISADGTPVDIVYEELRTMAPELFPASIMAESDQVQRIYDVGKMIRRIESNLNNAYGAQIEINDFKRWAKNDFDAAIDASIAELNRVRRYALEQAQRKTAPEITEQNVAYAFGQIRDAQHAMERAKARNLLTEYDNGQVGRLLRGEITLDDLDPNKVNVKGVREVYEASRAYDRYAETIRKYNKQRKASLLEEANGLLETANSWKDKPAGILYSRETMERNIRDIVPDRALANAINEKYFTPVHEAEAEGNKFKNEYRDRVRSLDLSRDVAEGNVVSEAHAVQLLGEASDNLQMLNEKGKYGETRDGKTAQEWEAAIRELWEQNPNLDRAKIENAVKEFRVIYDELFERMNEVRVRNGYEPVGYRKGYFPHFQPGETEGTMASFAKALGLDINVNTLPTSINGLTHTFRPGITWFGNAQERLGFDTAYDAVEGFDKYIEGVSDVVHQTDNIQRLRALATQIRYRTTDEGMRQQMDAIRSNQNLNEDEQRTKLDELYDKGRFTLGNFVVELEEYTNLLANKKSRADRDMEQRMGRQAYTAMKNLESRVAANMVAVNPGSWLTNFIPITQAWATVDSKTLLRGMRDTLAAYKNDDGMVARSAFLTNRRGSDPIVKTWAQKASAKLSSPMEYIDQFTADTLVRARYAQNIKSGLSEENAIREADAWAAGIMADRSKGSMPTIFNRSNPVTKLFTQFQLEVNNEFSNIFKDVPDELKKKGAAALAAGLLKYFVGAWLYNEVYEYFVGRRAAFDPLDITNDFVGDLTGYQLPNTIEGIENLVRGQAYGFETKKAGAYGALENFAKNAAEELPFVGGILGGGRVPISSALPDWENLAKAAVNDQWDDRKRRETAIKELGKPATYLALPFGGGQLRKIYQGIKAVKEGGSYSVDSQGRDILQYPVFNDTPSEVAGSAARALLFGKSSMPEARKWVDSGFDSMGAKQTAVYQGMNAAGVSDRDAYALLRKMENAPRGEGESADTAKRHVLQASEISGEGKSVVYYGLLASEKEQELMDSMPDGTDMGAVTETLMQFKDANTLAGAEATRAKRSALLDADLMETEKRAIYRVLIGDKHEDDLDELAAYGLGIDDWMRYESNAAGLSKREEKLAAIDAMDLTNEQKDAIYFAAGYSERTLKDAPWHTGESAKYQLPGVNMSAQWTSELSAGLNALQQENGATYVSDLQKSSVIVNSNLSLNQQLQALASTMSESEYGKVQAGVSAGVMPKAYITLLENLPRYDDGNGTYSQKEVKAAIDAMDNPAPQGSGALGRIVIPTGGLTTEQKAALWQMVNKGWKAKNNPYSVRVGQQVYDAIHGIVIENPPLTLYAAPDISAGLAKGTP